MRSDKRRMRPSVSMCGLVKPPNDFFDSIINFDSPLPPRFEEYKCSGDYPQWHLPSIMCCVRPPQDGNGKPLPATQFTAYRMVSSCYPFAYQDEFALPDGEYLSTLFPFSGVPI